MCTPANGKDTQRLYSASSTLSNKTRSEQDRRGRTGSLFIMPWLFMLKVGSWSYGRGRWLAF